MKKHYLISYWFDTEESELHLTILAGKNPLYTEDIIGVEDEEDAKLTCLEVAQSRGYFPTLFEDDAVRYGRLGGKKSSATLTSKQRSQRAKKAGRKRWEKQTRTVKG